jgi:hypothetical protein
MQVSFIAFGEGSIRWQRRLSAVAGLPLRRHDGDDERAGIARTHLYDSRYTLIDQTDALGGHVQKAYDANFHAKTVTDQSVCGYHRLWLRGQQQTVSRQLLLSQMW